MPEPTTDSGRDQAVGAAPAAGGEQLGGVDAEGGHGRPRRRCAATDLGQPQLGAPGTRTCHDVPMAPPTSATAPTSRRPWMSARRPPTITPMAPGVVVTSVNSGDAASPSSPARPSGSGSGRTRPARPGGCRGRPTRRASRSAGAGSGGRSAWGDLEAPALGQPRARCDGDHQEDERQRGRPAASPRRRGRPGAAATPRCPRRGRGQRQHADGVGPAVPAASPRRPRCRRAARGRWRPAGRGSG